MRQEKKRTIDNNIQHGTIVIQSLLPWNAPKDKLSETIRMDPAGRAQLIAALTSGADSIEVYGASGELYPLYLRSIR